MSDRPPTAQEFHARKDWSMKMQEKFAIPIYKEYWSLSDDQITEVDNYAETEHVAMQMDQIGVDKIVQPETGVRYLPQRFRTLSSISGGRVKDPDFSLRTVTYGDHKTEYDKLMNAYRNGGQVPKLYSFGIGAAVSKRDCRESGFKDFYFLNLPRFLKLVDSGKVQACSSPENGDGTKALYFEIQDLRDNRIIQNEISGSVLTSCWSDGDTSDDFPTAPGIKNTGQVKISDFGGGD